MSDRSSRNLEQKLGTNLESENRLRNLISSGNSRLDDILGGGMMANCFILIEGDPGAGKTTLALQFALEGARQGEGVLYLALSEGEDELQSVAESHDFDLQGVSIVDLSPGSDVLNGDDATIFHPNEIELGELTSAIMDAFEKVQPKRVVIDSLSELRYLAQSELRYRRQLLALKSYFRLKDCTVLLIDDRQDQPDLQLQSVARGTIELQRYTPDYGRIRRRLQVSKMRGQVVRSGYHEFSILKGGLEIYPRLIAAEHVDQIEHGALSSGLEPLDRLLGGGMQRGTSSLVIGAAGTGKSSLSAQYACSATRYGRSAIYVFDETAANYLCRCDGLNIPVREMRGKDQLLLRQIDSAELAPGEFAWDVRQVVEHQNVRFLVIDSLNGYMHSMPGEDYLRGQLHELLGYLSGKGVTTIITLSQHGLIGDRVEAPVDTSYLADANLLIRYFEYRGEVRKAISVLKKRTGGHEKTIRELHFSSQGLVIGSPLTNFTNVLSGIPKYIDDNGALLPDEEG